VGKRMGGGAFNWLKMGRIGAESAKQAEIGVADLWQILSITVTERGAEVRLPSGGHYRRFPATRADSVDFR
jgi:hypothetical protein